MPSHRATAVAIILLAACTSTPDAHDGFSRVEIRDIRLRPSPLVDILFVIDAGPTMADAQASLAVNARKFIDVLEQIGATDLQLAVTTADGSGTLLGAGCPGLAPGARWIRDARRGDLTIRNYTGDLRDVFACAAAVGTAGPAVRQPLASLRHAIERNPGLVRADAVLYVVILSDADDCSLRDGVAAPADPFACVEAALACDEADLRAPGEKHHCRAGTGSPLLADVDDHVRFLRDVKGADGVRVAAVIGPDAPVVVVDGPALAPSCTSATATARPALRTRALVDAIDGSPLVPSLCAADFSDALAGLAGFGEFQDAFCLEGTPRDADPSTPGLQPDCAMTLVRDADTADERDTTVPGCDPLRYATPCWQLVPFPGCVATPALLAIDLDFGDQPVPPNVILHAECAID